MTKPQQMEPFLAQGGVLTFIFADLIILPILHIYKK